jgi:hypothetical protein
MRASNEMASAARDERRLENDDIRTRIAEEAALLNKQQEARRLERQLSVYEQANGFLRDARGMRPDAPEFDTQLGEMLAGYPDALEHPAAKQWFDYHTDRRKKYLEEKPFQQKLTEAEAMSAAQAKGTASVKPPKPEESDTYEKFYKDIDAARKVHGVPVADPNAAKPEDRAQKSLPPAIQAEFEARGAKLSQPQAPAPVVATPTPAPVAAPAFKEGEIRVKNGINYKRDANGQWHPLP